jgi:hypothetical protein
MSASRNGAPWPTPDQLAERISAAKHAGCGVCRSLKDPCGEQHCDANETVPFIVFDEGFCRWFERK